MTETQAQANEEQSARKIVLSAKYFALGAHAAIGQRRKYTNEPYANHSMAVACLVESVGGTPEQVAAAWLHDVVEDTQVTIEEIAHIFGSTISGYVAGLTDVSGPDDGNRSARKAIDRAHIAKQSPQTKTIKLADLIDNARSIQMHDPDFARIYMAEKRDLLFVLADGDLLLLRRAMKIVADYYADTPPTFVAPADLAQRDKK